MSRHKHLRQKVFQQAQKFSTTGFLSSKKIHENHIQLINKRYYKIFFYSLYNLYSCTILNLNDKVFNDFYRTLLLTVRQFDQRI